MAQVVTTRLIHGSFAANPGSGSLQSCAEKLKPCYGFAAKVLAQTEKRRRPGALHVSAPITARRSAHVESEVIPVSPEDVPKVCYSFIVLVLSRMLIYFGGKCSFLVSLTSFFWERVSLDARLRVIF